MEQILNDLTRSIGRIEGKVDGITDVISSMDKRTNGLEKSVTTLQVNAGITTTKVSLISAVVGAIGSFIMTSIFGHAIPKL